jgi:hypothetical protein
MPAAGFEVVCIAFIAAFHIDGLTEGGSLAETKQLTRANTNNANNPILTETKQLTMGPRVA